jgi:hypothetical protein
MEEKPVELKPVTVIAATKYTSGGRGEPQWRYVVLKWDKGTSAHPFSRHMQVLDVKHEWNDQIFYHGNYCCTYEDAEKSMIESMEDHNRTYGPTNISHIPGLDFLWDVVKNETIGKH